MAKYALSLLMALFVALAAGEMRAADAAADPAARQIEQFYAALIDTMKNGRELGIQGRYRQLAPVAEDTFDLEAMTRLTVGPAWSTMSEPDHKAVTDAFAYCDSAYAALTDASGAEVITITQENGRQQQQTRAGLVWQGEWRDATGTGGFRFVLGAPGVPANQFQGTYTTAGVDEPLAWNGVRETAGHTPQVPCTWQE